MFGITTPDVMNLTDTHCHLDLHKFDPDRESVLSRAQEAGVRRILIPGVTLTLSRCCVKTAESHPMLFAAVGIHPTEAATFSDPSLDEIRTLAHNPKVKAIGEIGLDYYWDSDGHEIQKHALREQLDLAEDLNLPAILHFREKDDAQDGACASELFEILEKWVNDLQKRRSPRAEYPGVLHSFSGSLSMAQRAIEMNFYIGVTGPVTYNKKRQEIIEHLPLERLLSETDAPFLSPAPLRGKRNEPANVRLIADKIASLHAQNPEKTASAMTANANHLFDWE
jgi:TatD DNase family protein